ncbi:HNH endonuclease signature motif containing protein [Halorussus halophilus]|uniref:HNH endonuclease signature motif containing protein n=1 Tax=Halorussus halophilus TaxID=2650975 RepID=UPI001787B9E3|nr:HNH endonuclease [Halorussus halophilus]
MEELEREVEEYTATETRRRSAAATDYPGEFSLSSLEAAKFWDNDQHSSIKSRIVEEIRRSQEYQELTAELEDAKSALDDVYYEIVSLAPQEATYEEKIHVFYEAIRWNKRSIDEYIGCVSQYTHRFYWDDEREMVREKNWSQKRKDAQVTGPHREQILKEYDSGCVKCGNRNEDEIVIHHIETVVEGGTSDNDNLAPLCVRCHKESHDGNPAGGGVIYDSVAQFWEWANN